MDRQFFPKAPAKSCFYTSITTTQVAQEPLPPMFPLNAITRTHLFKKIATTMFHWQPHQLLGLVLIFYSY